MLNATTSLKRINKLKKVAVAALLIYLVIYYVLLWVLKQDYAVIASDLMSPLGIIVSLIIMFYAIQLCSLKKTKHIWIIFFLAAVAYLMGDLQGAYNELIQGTNPFGSAADTYYSISGFLVVVGFFLHIPQKSKFSVMRSGFDVLIMMVIYLAVETQYILLPVMNNRVLTAVEKFASLAYPIFDAGLFMAIILLYFNDADEKRYYRSKIMLVIAGVWLFADQVFSIQSILGVYKSGSYLEPLWAAAFIGLSIVALLSAEFYLYLPESTDNTDQSGKEGMVNKRVIFTYSLMIIFMAVWCFNYYQQDPLSIGGIIIIILLILRQYFSYQENRRLMQLLIQSNVELLEAQSRVEYELRTDYLTRLFNRRYIDGALDDLKKSVTLNTSPFSVLVLDIDHFKKINDQYGHSTGDQVLQQIAEIINMNIRKDDIAARWGGEEFMLILPNTDDTLAYTIGERIRRAIDCCHFKSDNSIETIRLSASIGISEVKAFEQDFSEVLLRADQGMYEAKNAGRNRTVIKTVH